MRRAKTIAVPAFQVKQGKKRIYLFSIDGKRVEGFAAISRLRREEDGDLLGYQRPEVYSHIDEIRQYLESAEAMLPNTLLLAFSSKVRFQSQAKSYTPPSYCKVGTLYIPYWEGMTEREKPARVVDGQQRLAAIREASIKAFPVCVAAWITDDVQDQRNQFVLVNSAKPLTRGLVYENLPGTTARLPAALARRRLPATIVNELNSRTTSPFFGRINTATNPRGDIKDNSVLRMLEASLTNGVLYQCLEEGENEAEQIEATTRLVADYWNAVAQTFPEAWREAPSRSRLTHGVGILSMGLIMEEIVEKKREGGRPSVKQFEVDLKRLAPACRWTQGYWQFDRATRYEWNALQNTNKHIKLLSDHLVDRYQELAGA